MEKQYDFLIVGAGLWGSVFAYEAGIRGKKCLVIDKRCHTGGNVYCDNIADINVHKYGAHIFHTNDKEVWDFINQFSEFNHYCHTVLANYNGTLYNLPFNMNTFYALWKVKTPEEAKEMIEKQVAQANISNPTNLREQAISLVGTDVFETLIKEYTEKQWGKLCEELPAFIIKRLPVRFNFDNSYFNDKYQGIPVGGYNPIIKGLLQFADIKTDVNFFENKDYFTGLADIIVYTGKIDEYYDFCFGELEYRSLRFETEVLDTENYQGIAVLNYTDKKTPYTRIIEHKHFEFGRQPKTVITKEYSETYVKGAEPYYPVNDDNNTRVFNQYKALSEKESNVIFGGRLAEYRYYDMHQIIASSLQKAKKFFELRI